MNYRENIERVLDAASMGDWAEGMDWYSEAHALALDLSPSDPWRAAGVIAALSPMKKWDLNKSLAIRAFETGTVTGHTSTMNRIAQAILDGSPTLEMLKGDKTRAFASAIATNGDTDMVTIDRHAHDVAMHKVFTDADRKIGKRIYREMSSAYLIVADAHNLSGCQVQAITWVAWKRLKSEGLVS